MKGKTYILPGLILTLIIGGLVIWNFSANTASAQKSENNLGVVAGVNEYNPRDEFALTQGGTNGLWNYGYSTSDADNTLNLFNPATDTKIDPGCSGSMVERWLINGGDEIPQVSRLNPAITCGNIPSNAVFIHPGGNNQRAVLRFNVPASGTFQIVGTFQKQDTSATSDLKIIKNAATAGETVLYAGSLGAVYQQQFNLTATLAVGDKIDFSVGDGDNNYFSDGSSIAVTIGQPVTACTPAPANWQVNVPAENSPSDVQSVNTNASLVGDATYTNTGKVGRAFSFDGSGDYVRVEDNAAQRPATAVTEEGWFKFNSTSGVVSLISKPLRNSPFNSHTLYLDGGQLRGLIGNTSQFTRALSNFSPQLGVWHHLAFTYSFSNGVSTLKLYANGVDVTSGQDGTANLPISYDANPYPLLIGADFENNNPQFFLDGQADEVSVYDRALSPAEIFNLAKQSGFGKCQPANCVQSPNNLVSWYQGEQNALDSKSNNHGALQGGATFQTGKVGQAFNFPDGNAYVSVPDSPSLRPTSFTVEGWFNFDNYNNEFRGLFKKQTSDPQYESFGMYIYGGLLSARTTNGTMTGNGVDYVFAPTSGQWYHLAYSWQSGGNETLYVNGVAVASNSADLAPVYTNNPLIIGDNSGASLQGKIDEFSIYNRALSAAEIQSIVSAGQSGKCKPAPLNPPTNQIAWFTGDGDARDFTGLNSNGTLQGDTNYKIGKAGQSFNFDGSGDYISTADSPNWDFGTGDFAIEGWFNAPNPTGAQRIISAGSQADGANNLWTLGYGDIGAWGGGQRLNFAVFNGGGYSDFSSNQVAFRPNTWHHAAVVRTGTSFTFYLDGGSIGTVPVGAGFAVNGGSTGAIIGARYNNNPSLVFEFANGRLDEISVYNRGLSASEISAVYNAGAAGKLKSVATPVNFNRTTKTLASLAPTTVQLSGATVTFAQVTAAGTTSENAVDPGLLPKLPPSLTFTGLAYDISTTAGYQNGAADDVRVCFNAPALSALTNLRILHLEGGVWIDRTAAGNVFPNLCTDNLTSLSPFAIVQGLAPTAATVSVSGKVLNQSGGGLSQVIVTLTDTAGRTVSTRTNNFGRYRFENGAVGAVYFVSVRSKRYYFAQNTQVINLFEAIDNVNFTAADNPPELQTVERNAEESKP